MIKPAPVFAVGDRVLEKVKGKIRPRLCTVRAIVERTYTNNGTAAVTTLYQIDDGHPTDTELLSPNNPLTVGKGYKLLAMCEAHEIVKLENP